ncbi:TPA: copper resistance protein [Klebsiella quasipneumoniae]|uniref:copper resistance protein n=1 Tax=Klebsiella quasipneumoniae TaxID=1463165 RepID=UPI000C7B283B|nr:copper resistance protein [Klebsiella quasipneumoniae]PLC94463.1 copper resistance protein [Klebsiella quasipneumoniae]HBR1669791.1 copper resistance protein [Klebsiella quasipneumoniae subsp. quasipneumoniae]HCI4598695.1 copper resistance protein [Klebsiella quasipneumoniae subsp. quasipneumoniae]HDK6580144.1 copper resistance protein [Klebsiella quasipneumoniae]
MIKRQRKAILFVLLACLVVLVCTAQRMAGMHALVMNLAADSPSLQQTQDKADAPVTPCELSAKSLMAVPPMLFEGALLAITLLLAVLAAITPRIERQWPPRVISPPRLRVHLRLCVFRE